MPDALELVAKLTAHGTSLTGGRGGKDTLTAQDLAAAISMAGLDPVQEHLVYVSYADDMSKLPMLRTAWYLRCADMATMGKWQLERGIPRVRWLSWITLGEHLSPPLCPRCNGAGRHHNQQDCAGCGATGRVEARKPEHYAEDMRVSVDDWTNTWKIRHANAMSLLQLLEADASVLIRRALRW